MMKRIGLGVIAVLASAIATPVMADPAPLIIWQVNSLFDYQQRQICNSLNESVTDEMMEFERRVTFDRVAATATQPQMLADWWETAKRAVETSMEANDKFRADYCSTVAADISKRMKSAQRVEELVGDMPTSGRQSP